MLRVRCAIDSSNVHDVFCTSYTVTSAVTQVHYNVSDLLTIAYKHANDSLHYLYATPTYIIGFAIMYLFKF